MRSTKRFIGVTRIATSLGYYLTIPLLGVVALRAGAMSPIEVGTLVAVHAVFRRGLALPVGVLCDRRGAERVLVLGLVAEAAGYALLASSITFPIWLAALVVDGAGGAAYNSAGRVVLARVAKDDGSSARSFAGFYVATQVGALAGPLAGALVSAGGAPRLVLVLSAVVYLGAAAGALLRYRKVERTPPVRRQGSLRTAFAEPLRHKLFVGHCVLTVPMWFGVSLFVSAVPLEAEHRGLQYVDVGLINSMNALVVVALGHVAGRLTEGWAMSRRWVLLGGGSLVMAAGCLLCLPAGTPWFYAGMLVVTVGELALIVAADVVASELAPNGATGVYLGYTTMSWGLGAVLAGLLSGFLLDGSSTGRLWFWPAAAALLLTGATGLVTVGRRQARRPTVIAATA
ncbi:MFS transporter [Amycolatopsis sp. NBC_01307]|uniref:MFS transporter n=1 Tax=Amycolatopsis sp. NBC_01307 TaxID=2903561 RepID=UPI002E102026|nr:MFS transporter [Amycolatopsis sp. NBC_01307]